MSWLGKEQKKFGRPNTNPINRQEPRSVSRFPLFFVRSSEIFELQVNLLQRGLHIGEIFRHLERSKSWGRLFNGHASVDKVLGKVTEDR